MVQKTKAAETPELSQEDIQKIKKIIIERVWVCLLYTSDAADEL